jgi:hypothetical protein
MKFMDDDLVQLWHYVTHLPEADLIAAIEEMSQKYEDPEDAEIYMISIWKHIHGFS